MVAFYEIHVFYVIVFAWFVPMCNLADINKQYTI